MERVREKRGSPARSTHPVFGKECQDTVFPFFKNIYKKSGWGELNIQKGELGVKEILAQGDGKGTPAKPC
jgi:hypothetical protein